METGIIWYISKYVAPPAEKSVGSRGFLLMKHLANRGHSVAIFTSDANHLATPPVFQGRYFCEVLSGVPIFWIRTMKYGTVRSLRRVLSWLDFEWKAVRFLTRKQEVPDVIIASSLSLTSFATGVYLSKRLKARLVLEVRDIWPLTLTEEGGFSPHNPLVVLMARLERYGYARADAIVGTMPNLEAHVRAVSKTKAPVYCVPMGYEETEPDPATRFPEEYTRAMVPAGKFLVGYVGSVGATNALDTLLEAARILSDEQQIHFVVVGDGDLREALEREYRGLSNVTFVGRVPRNGVGPVLQEFDALYFSTFPSKVWSYGQSLNKVVDYMLAGKPIVASYSGYESMINEAGCGYYIAAGDSVALADEISRLSELEAGELSRMGRRGRKWVLENRHYSTLAETYESILFPRGEADEQC